MNSNPTTPMTETLKQFDARQKAERNAFQQQKAQSMVGKCYKKTDEIYRIINASPPECVGLFSGESLRIYKCDLSAFGDLIEIPPSEFRAAFIAMAEEALGEKLEVVSSVNASSEISDIVKRSYIAGRHHLVSDLTALLDGHCGSARFPDEKVRALAERIQSLMAPAAIEEKCNRCHQTIDGLFISDPHSNTLCPSCYGETEVKPADVGDVPAAPDPIAEAAKELAEAFVARVDCDVDDSVSMDETGCQLSLAEKAYRAALAANPAERKVEPGPAVADTIGGFSVVNPNCAGCGKPLTVENAWLTDGCPCNSPLGVNSMNETRWRLLMDLQQKQSREIEALAAFKAYVHKRLDDAGVPVDPESTHKAQGCRIGGRLDIVLSGIRIPNARP